MAQESLGHRCYPEHENQRPDQRERGNHGEPDNRDGYKRRSTPKHRSAHGRLVLGELSLLLAPGHMRMLRGVRDVTT